MILPLTEGTITMFLSGEAGSHILEVQDNDHPLLLWSSGSQRGIVSIMVSPIMDL